MAKKKNLSIEERTKVVVLVQEGYSMNEVARRMKISRSCVQEIVKKQKETGTVVDRHRSGRSKFSTKRQDHELVRLSLQDRKTTVPELRYRWVEASGVSVNTQTVCRHLLRFQRMCGS